MSRLAFVISYYMCTLNRPGDSIILYMMQVPGCHYKMQYSKMFTLCNLKNLYQQLSNEIYNKM